MKASLLLTVIMFLSIGTVNAQSYQDYNARVFEQYNCPADPGYSYPLQIPSLPGLSITKVRQSIFLAGDAPARSILNTTPVHINLVSWAARAREYLRLNENKVKYGDRRESGALYIRHGGDPMCLKFDVLHDNNLLFSFRASAAGESYVLSIK